MSSVLSRPRHGGAAQRTRGAHAGEGGGNPAAVLVNGVVFVVGILGALCLVLVLMPFAGWQLVVLTSGSMSPGLPAGSIVVTHELPASEVAVGDIVTVAGESSQVTHRVVSIEGDSTLLDTRTLTLKGDANSSVDPRTYEVATAGVVAFGLPWGGQLVLGMRNPLVIGAISVAVALLVLWAWWPKRDDAGEEP